MFQLSRNRKREQITSLTFLRYLQTPNALKRIIAHASRREPSTLLLCISLNFADFQKQESKLMLQRICLFFFAMLSYAVFLGFYIIYQMGLSHIDVR